MSNPSLSTEASRAGNYPSIRFGQRERKLLATVKDYVDSLSPDTVITSQGDLIIGNSSGDATRLAKGTSGLPLVAGASTLSYTALTAAGLASNAVTTAKILDANVTLAKLAAGIAPAYIVVAAGTFTTLGGDANESITVSGALVSDIAFVVLKTKGATPRTILTAAAASNAINVEMSGDPSTDHVLAYQLLRAAS